MIIFLEKTDDKYYKAVVLKVGIAKKFEGSRDGKPFFKLSDKISGTLSTL